MSFPPRGYVAACRLNMGAGTIVDIDGFESTGTDNGPGDWTLTLGSLRAIDAEDRHVNVTILGATPGMVSFENVSDTQIQVHTLNAAGAAADFDVSIEVVRKTVGTL